MNIIRKIKLNSLGYYKFTDEEQKIFEIYEKYFKEIDEVVFNYCPDYVIYFKNKQYIFEYYKYDIPPEFEINKIIYDEIENIYKNQTSKFITKLINDIFKLNMYACNISYHWLHKDTEVAFLKNNNILSINRLN